MRRTNSKIGFDDRLVMAAGILLFPLFIPIVFFGLRFGRAPYYTFGAWLTTLVNTAVIWFGSRYIMIWARGRYPLFNEVKKRLLVQVSVILVFTLLANNVVSYLMKDMCFLGSSDTMPRPTMADILINCNAASIFCTMLVMTIYESVYFMNGLRESVRETEMLKRENLEAQLNALKIQVNPHFLFNNLNTLSAVIYDNPAQAIDFVQQLSKVYRHILEVKDEPSILLREELDVLKAYAFLLKTRFGSNLCISIHVEEEKLQQRIAPLSLQILMENAIKHNIISSARPLQIDVFAAEGRLVVRNNLQKKLQAEDSTGLGLDNIRSRYRLLGNRQVVVEEGLLSFTVSIPLMN